MKTIVRNFLNVLNRFRMASFLNIAGLSVAFAAFLLLVMQVEYEWGYDRFHTNADRLFRLEIEYNEWGAQVVLSRPLIDAFLASSPHVQKGTLIDRWSTEKYVTVESEGERQTFKEFVYTVYPAYADVLDFEMTEGEKSCLAVEGKVMIPERMARLFFGDEPAVGQVLIGEGWTAEVGGVYKDFPANSIISNVIYQKIPDTQSMDAWGQSNYECYLLLDDPASAPKVLDNFRNTFRRDDWDWKEKDLRLVNLPDVHFKTDCNFDSQKEKGSYAQLQVLLGIAILIVLIATINFMNFSNALVPMRLRSVNTQKVLGSSVSLIRVSMLLEAVGICLLSYMIALLIVYCLSGTSMEGLISGGISLASHIRLLVGGGAFVVVVGVAAGSWPSWYITSFPPALVLKGNFGLSPKGRSFRNVLVGIQFIASFVLVIAALFITWQNNSMLRTPLGFDKDRIAVVKLNKKLRGMPELIRQRLTTLTGVEALSFVSNVPGGGDEYSSWGRDYKGENIQVTVIQADMDILKVLDLPLLEGRDFLPEDLSGDGTYVFNEQAKELYKLNAGDVIALDWGDMHIRETVAGFVPDIKYNSFRGDLSPFAFFVGKNTMAGARENLMIRVRPGTDYAELKEKVEGALQALDTDYPLDMRFYNEIQERLYQKELLLGKQISFFSLLAMFISLVGVFGVVLFESEYKRKEISIRKVFGASMAELLRSSNLIYLRIVTVCFLIAAPVAWYGVERWQENFTFKVTLHWWLFLAAYLFITFITLATVTFQNWQAANENPVDSIKRE